MDKGAAWDRFWRYDRLASFGTGVGAGNYDEPIAAGWRDFFVSLPAGGRVLDLATGNGAIAVMALAAGDALQVTGVDLAAVKPAAFVSGDKAALERIHFLAATPIETLPLDGGQFDAVVSQYGVEYSDLERSLPEAARMLAGGGQLRFACHAAEGSVAGDTRRAIGDADFVLDEIDLTGRAAACIRAILDVERGRARGPFAPTAAQASYADFRNGLKALANRVPTAVDAAMLTSVHQSLTDLFQQRQAQGEAALQAQILDLRDEVDAHRERQRALLAAAQSGEQMTGLARRLGELGMADVTLGEQRDESDRLIGHVIAARTA